jgi:AcrR family transcriptional regulator
MTKAKILEKALELFATKGYFNCSMDDIAKAVNIRKPSLYFHYPSKESIFQAVFDKILENYEKFISGITNIEEGKSSLETLSDIFAKYVNNCIDNLEMVFWDRYYYYPPDCFIQELHDKTSSVETAFMGKIFNVIETGIGRNEIKPLDSRSITSAFYNMMIGLAMSVRFYTGEQIDEEIRRCLDTFLQAIRI